MKIQLPALALLPLLASLAPAPAGGTVDPAPSAKERIVESPRGAFLLQWDDTVDEQLPEGSKSCWVELERVDAVVTGRFLGPVLGESRRATFTGEVAGDEAGGLMMLQQREAGYVCSYQLTFDGRRSWRGTWRDSKGRAGTVTLGWRTFEPRR